MRSLSATADALPVKNPKPVAALAPASYPYKPANPSERAIPL